MSQVWTALGDSGIGSSCYKMSKFCKSLTSLGFSRGGKFRRASLAQDVQCEKVTPEVSFPAFLHADCRGLSCPLVPGTPAPSGLPRLPPALTHPGAAEPRAPTVPRGWRAVHPACLPGTAAAGNTDPATTRCCCNVAQVYFCEGDGPTSGTGL